MTNSNATASHQRGLLTGHRHLDAQPSAHRGIFRTVALVLALITGVVTAFAAPASAAHGQGTLRSGETLLPGQYLIVPGHAQLIMQTDGNLVLYRLVSTPPYKTACAASRTRRRCSNSATAWR